jgi:dTDP-glucose 4,6-dehydratase
MRKIIVTGGLGFIGSNLIELLINKKFEVINLDKVTYSSNFYNTKDFTNSSKYRFIKCDLNDKNKLSKVIFRYKPICIFNLAAETHVDRSIDGPESFIKSNILGVFNLLEIFKKFSKINKKTKLIHISTDEVYGDILTGRSSESYPYKPSSPYAASKAASDHLVSSYVRTYKIPAIITNCSNNYGPKQHPEKLIPKIIYNILNNKSLPIYGDGKNSREWIYVKDHCEALFKVYQKGKIGEFYNIGSNKNLNNLQICSSLIKIAKKIINVGSNVKIKFVKDRPGHDVRYALNSKKMLTKLKWKSKINLNDGLRKTFLWYLKNEEYYKSISKVDIVKRLGKL